MKSHARSGRGLLAKNSLFNLVGLILPMLVGIATIPYIVKGLGANGYGILSIAYMVLGYFGIFDLGLSRAAVKFVSAHLSPEQVHKVPELVWTSLFLLIALGCIGGTLVALLVPIAVTHWFKMPLAFVGQARTSLFILAASMPIVLSNDALRGVLEAAQRFDLVNLVKVPGSVLFYLLAAMAIPFGLHVSGIVLILVLIRLSTSFAYLMCCLRVFPGLLRCVGFSKASMRPLATYGGWIMVSNLTAPIFGWMERFMIASFLSIGMLTYYSVPFDLASKVLIFPSCIAPALFPYFSFQGDKGSAAVSDVSTRAVKYLLLLMTPITAIFIFFAKDILQLWLGAQFASESTVVLQLTAISIFFNSFAFIPFTSVQALGRPELKAILDLAALPVYAFGCWWLMRIAGVNGAALAKLAVTIMDCAFLYYFARRMRVFRVDTLFSGPLCRALIACAVFFVSVYLVHSMHGPLIVSAILVAVCCTVYAVVFWMLATDSEERTVLKRLSPLILLKKAVEPDEAVTN